MKQYIKKHYYFLICCVIAVGLSITVIVQAVERHDKSGHRSLKDAAVSSKSRVVSHRPLELKTIYEDLHALAAPSTIVVIGTPVSSEGLMTASEQNVLTNYRFKVEEVVKGNIHPGEFLAVRLPGGKVDFGKGSTAEVFYPGNPFKLSHGQRYALYLRPEPGNAYTLTGGPQGAFLLLENGVRSNDHLREWDPVVAKYQGMDVNTFLLKVRDSVKN